jgi:hypothetical protein
MKLNKVSKVTRNFFVTSITLQYIVSVTKVVSFASFGSLV